MLTLPYKEEGAVGYFLCRASWKVVQLARNLFPIACCKQLSATRARRQQSSARRTGERENKTLNVHFQFSRGEDKPASNGGRGFGHGLRWTARRHQ